MKKLFSFEKNLWENYNPLISSINQIEHELITLSDSALKEKSKKLRFHSLDIDKKLNSKILIESFALVREASRRTLDLRHYDTQLLGGLILNDNKIAEMRTGEGKTLVATAPAYVNALSGKGVHIVTVNEYLAQRDAEWMGQIYRCLGLRVGLILSNMKSDQKRKNYSRDITYMINHDLGFDFLRDNLVTQTSDIVQRSFYFCIVDEVDSILIDEARTPLIISGPSKIEIIKIIKATEVVKFLSEIKHYIIDQKSKNISLTSLGVRRIQRLLKVDNIYNPNDPWIPFILDALKAKTLFLKDIHYIIKSNTVVLIDEFTGRILKGRKWSGGLQSAVEVKENIYNTEGSTTIASITYQNLFRLYPKIAGMTGTAKTEELEFEKVYNLTVSVLPTFKPSKREDLPDTIYIDQTSKWKAIVEECRKMFQIKRPVLIGTTTIKNSENLSLLLQDSKIPHELLNAKPENIKRESEIIAQAGCLSSITIATNMAGRGTDILLGGNPEFKAYREVNYILEAIINHKTVKCIEKIDKLINQIKYSRETLVDLCNDFKTFFNVIKIPNRNLNKFESLILNLYNNILMIYQLECKNEKEQVIKLGGLYVIGTERHESRRIDNQLRGRAGRQGDPGTSRFFLSFDDPLLENFGGNNMKNVITALQMNDEVIESNFLVRSLDSAQQKVEGFYYDTRKTLNKYDRILEKQRSTLYNFRRKILISSTIRDFILELGEAFIDDLVQLIEIDNSNIKIPKRIYYFLYALNLSLKIDKNIKIEKLKDLFYEQFWSAYFLKELNFWSYNLRSLRRYEKILVLKSIDVSWSKHLESINFLKDSVNWGIYAQKDPLILYEERASFLFRNIFKECRNVIIYQLLCLEFI